MRDPLHALRALDRRQPLWWDAGLAVLVAVVSFNAGAELNAFGAGILVVVSAAVAFRRRRPLAALLVASGGVVIATVGALLASWPPPWIYLAIWVLLFAVALRVRPRTSVVSAAVVVAVTAVAALIAPPSLGSMPPTERVSLVVAFAGMSAASFLLGLQVREHRRRLADEQAEIAREAALAERSRIAQEMHDAIGHNLSVISALAAGGGVAARTSPDDAVRAFDAIGQVSRSSVREVRRVLRVLRHDGSPAGAPLAPQPGSDDLAELLDAVRSAGIDVVLQQRGDVRGLDPGRQLAIYRIVQESLTNVLRHAGRHVRARVEIIRGPEAVTVTVTDSGGATGQAALPGHGLPGMRERAAAYGGEFEAGPVEGGWRVWARIPLDDLSGTESRE